MRKFSLSSTLFYEGQVPIVAYLVIDGSVALLKKKKIKNIIKAGSLIGVNELMTNSPSKMSAEVAADTTLCFLDKSTMLEIMNYEKSELSKLLSETAEMKFHGYAT